MKKYIKRVMILAIMMVAMISPMSAHASTAYKTFTISVDGEMIETQTAYEAVGIISNSQIQTPQDIFIDRNGIMYIADSENKQIIVLDQNRRIIKTVGEGYLENPTGVAVDADGNIFVADATSIISFSESGEMLREFGRPESPLFGERQPFIPLKIDLDVRGNMYIVGDGASNGIIQLNRDGEFLGYFGANTTTLSFFQAFRNLVMSGNDLTSGFLNVPLAPTNIAINERGIVYTVTFALDNEPIKKLNVAGSNMLSGDMIASNEAIDIAVGNQGNFYVLAANGRVYEYDSTGNLLFVFGSQDSNSQRLGVFRQPTSIAVGIDGTLYVADAERGVIHMLTPTEFTDKVHLGLAYFEEGLYVQSEEYWQEVLQLNSSFGLAHIALGQSYFKQMEYEAALERFELANYTAGYSEAFWEIRHAWLQEHTATVLLITILVIVAWKILKFADKKTGCLQGVRDIFERLNNIKLIRELLVLRKLFRHPIDTFYDIKRKNIASVTSATILYGLFFIVFFISLYAPGFIFASNVVRETGIPLLVSIFFGAVALFVTVNYLVSTINDGEGSFTNVYVGTAYSFAPYIVFVVPITLLSRVLTSNEAFLYDFSMQVMIAWSLLILFIMVKEIHNYSFGGTVKNILLTLFGSIITVTIIFLMYVLLNQVFDFVYSIIQEVLVRV